MDFYPSDPSIIHEGPRLTLLFRVTREEGAESLYTFRAAFGAATDIEAVDENTYTLHIRPGACTCGGGETV